MFPRPLLIALGLLSRIPLPPWQGTPTTAKEMGRSLLYYPLVGVIIAALLILLAWILRPISDPWITAAILLTTWVWLTGGLHLDGLADSADGWIGGMGNRERTLAIMKDPSCGPAGVMSIVLLLILKLTALQALITHNSADLLMMPLLLGRAGIIALFLKLPYVRVQGMGELAAKALPRLQGWAVLIGCTLLITLYWQLLGIRVVLVWVGTWYLLQRAMQQRLGGITGDTIGGACEIMETTILLAMTMTF